MLRLAPGSPGSPVSGSLSLLAKTRRALIPRVLLPASPGHAPQMPGRPSPRTAPLRSRQSGS
eukprot:15230373-Heterocapsa_arctica.AAC.1